MTVWNLYRLFPTMNGNATVNLFLSLTNRLISHLKIVLRQKALLNLRILIVLKFQVVFTVSSFVGWSMINYDYNYNIVLSY